MKKRVCVVGGGPSGLVALKELTEAGHYAEAFEKSSTFGGVFSGEGSVSNRAYKGLMLTISNYYMAFSDFMPKDGYKIWTAQQYRDYLREYAETHNLMGLLTTCAEVISISFEGKVWRVKIKMQNTNTFEERVYDAVAICCGAHQDKNTLHIAKDFTGEVYHAAQFIDSEPFKGKRVLSVGIGETSADVTKEVAQVAKECHLVVRTLPASVPRVTKSGAPSDCGTTRLIYTQHEDSFIIWVCTFVILLFFSLLVALDLRRWWNNFEGDTDAFGQSPKGKFMDFKTLRTSEIVQLMTRWNKLGMLTGFNKFQTKNVSWIPSVLSGAINFHVGSIVSIENKTVHLSDGSCFEIDTLLMCTGYNINFPFIEEKFRPPRGIRSLYKHTIHPLSDSLAYMGFARPHTGAIPACSELHARLFAQRLHGRVNIPKDIQRFIAEDKAKEEAMFYLSPDLETVVNPTDYMDSLARLIGCYTHPLQLLASPTLFLKWQTCLSHPCRYRLRGPGSNPDLAHKWIESIPSQHSLKEAVYLSFYRILNTLGIGTGDISYDLPRWFGIDVQALFQEN